MPNIISQNLNPSGFFVEFSDHSTISISFSQVKDMYDSTVGTPSTKRLAVITWFKNLFDNTMIRPSYIKDFDFREIDGVITKIKIGS